ncbi:MAG TPA: glycosyltransferase family 4 protein, partial [Pyrinomonadaceae bacterium]|nr:glycosyltransferase family 4 protein [Pyrinomonadaceae bacterium]
MRILVGIPEKGSQGGPAACEPPFIAELRRLGHEVVEEVYAYAETQSGLAVRASRVLGTARRFQHCVRYSRFDLVHINTSLDPKALLRDAVIVPRLSSRGAKIFLKFHGSDERLLQTKNPLLTALRRRLLSHADGIGVLSTAEQANFLRAQVPEQEVFVVKNVVEENSQERSPEFLRLWNLPDDRPLLLFIGRFVPTKGLLDVIAACALLRDAGHKFLLLCLGDGPARSAAELLVRRLNLQDCVRFFGYILEEQTAGFYANSTVLLFPTYHTEGFPMVIFNAAAAGLPIVTTRIRAAADYLKEPENCLWAEPCRPDWLVEKITELLTNDQLRLGMAANNKELAARFSDEIVTAEYLDAYRQITRA